MKPRVIVLIVILLRCEHQGINIFVVLGIRYDFIDDLGCRGDLILILTHYLYKILRLSGNVIMQLWLNWFLCFQWLLFILLLDLLLYH